MHSMSLFQKLTSICFLKKLCELVLLIFLEDIVKLAINMCHHMIVKSQQNILYASMKITYMVKSCHNHFQQLDLNGKI